MDGRPDGEILQNYEGIIREEDMLTAIDAIILDIEEAKTLIGILRFVGSEQLRLNREEMKTISELQERVDNIEQIKNTLYKLDI
jgi:hypothetical protein